MQSRPSPEESQSADDFAAPAIAVLGRERNRVARLGAVARARSLRAFEAALPLTETEVGRCDLLLVDGGGLSAEDRLWIRGLSASAEDKPMIVVTEAAGLETAADLIAEGADDVLDWTTLTSSSLARAVTLTLARRKIRLPARFAAPAVAPAPAPAKPSSLTLLQECASAILLVNPDGIVQFANPEAEALLGVPEGSLTGTPFALDVNQETREEIVLDGPDGKLVHAELRIVETNHGDVPMRVVTLQDMSLRHALTRHFAA